MNHIPKILILVFGLFPFVILQAGCVSSLSMITLPATAVNLGSMVYQSMENAQISIAMKEGLTKESLGKITRFAVFMGKKSRVRPYGRIGDPGAVVADNLAMELIRLGYSVCDSNDLERLNNGRFDESSAAIMFEAAKLLGAEVIVTGHVTAGQNGSLGIMGMGKVKTVIQGVSLKVSKVACGETLMLMTIDYKKGQTPRVVAEGVAMIVKTKMNDPQADIGGLFKNKEKQAPTHPEDVQVRSIQTIRKSRAA